MAVTRWCLVFAIFAPSLLWAAVLPEDRADILYHSYDGDGLLVDGPAVLVRKSFADKVSLWGRYYEDLVTGASIDIEAAGSSYFEEERKEYSLGADYLYDKTTLNFGYTNSDSGDYISDSYSLGVSHDFFGDLTTVALSFGYSDETVLENGNPEFEDYVTTQSYTLAASQILTKNIIVGLTAQTITSEGYLNNPYRSVRFEIPNSSAFGTEEEMYPGTRNSDAIAVRYNQYLPYRASIRGEYRFFSDNWGIRADTYRLDYIHPFEDWTLHLNLRYYEQTGADFYSDLFAFSSANSQFPEAPRGRDKELSTYETLTYGVGASYELPESWLPFMEKSSVNLFLDQVNYDYADFRDVTVTDENNLALPAGQEPLFSFDATVIRFFISFWY